MPNLRQLVRRSSALSCSAKVHGSVGRAFNQTIPRVSSADGAQPTTSRIDTPQDSRDLTSYTPNHTVNTARDPIRIESQRPGSPPVSAAWHGQSIHIWEEGRGQDSKRILHAQAIRDNCPCSRCRDVSSGQKSFATTQIPVDMAITSVQPSAQGLSVTFDRDIAGYVDHETIITHADLDTFLDRTALLEMDTPGKTAGRRRLGVQYWDRDRIERKLQHTSYSYHDYVSDSSDEVLWDVLVDLHVHGLAFLQDVPQDEDSVVKITSRIANLQETFYGRTFDVRAKPNAENVAYTSGYLGLHQDLLYLQSPPKIQILHCMENSCEGGSSLFSDGDRVGRMMYAFAKDVEKRASPLRALLDVKIPYAYKKHGYNYERSRPFMVDSGSREDGGAAFDRVWWSPPFQGRFADPSQDMTAWIRGARIFEDMVNDPVNMYERTMKPGECVLFDNHRVLHGRRAFDARGGGSRWLRGAYISEEDFYSKVSRVPEEVARRSRDRVQRGKGAGEDGDADAMRQLRRRLRDDFGWEGSGDEGPESYSNHW